jgi:CDGSH-type Zn-finger protein
MTTPLKISPDPRNESMKITVRKNGPYHVSGGIPLKTMEVGYDDEGNCRTWNETKTYPSQHQQYALCRCGHSKEKPFCDGAHAPAHFVGTEAGDRKPFQKGAGITPGPFLTLADNEHLCAHAGFCQRAGGIENLVTSSDPEARETAIEEGGNCPSGRRVISDTATGEAIEPDLEKSIAVIEDPVHGKPGPLWVQGGIPVIAVDGRAYEVRNRVTLCRCGKSKNKPFCDGSHLEE